MTTANKAIVAAVLAGLTSLVTDLQGADHALTFRDWIVLVLAAIIAGIGVYVVPNYSRGGARREAGAADLPTILIVVGLVLIAADLLFAQIWFGVGLGVLLIVIGVVLLAVGKRRV